MNHLTWMQIVQLTLNPLVICIGAACMAWMSSEPKVDPQDEPKTPDRRKCNEYIHINKTCGCCGRHHSNLPLDTRLDDKLRLFFFQCGDDCENTLIIGMYEPHVGFKRDRKAA